MTRTVYACDDCGWELPMSHDRDGLIDCEACGGPVVKVPAFLVATADLIEELVRSKAAPQPAEETT